MIFEFKNKDSGFAALVSVIIISAILMIVAVTLSFTGFYGRYNALESEFKKRSLALAEACADEALIKITNDALYTGSENIVVGDELCSIGPVSQLGSFKNFSTEAIFENSHTNLEISYDSVNHLIFSWEEVPNL